mmetsp:Transcript_7386/g.29923  ORF Transcript_7386/g.29923 Transcript_7386/m.29923 type:complete len:249 (+) Transcript_7386:2266-3012(+)
MKLSAVASRSTHFLRVFLGFVWALQRMLFGALQLHACELRKVSLLLELFDLQLVSARIAQGEETVPPALSRQLRVNLVDVPRESPPVNHRLLVLFEVIHTRGHRAVPAEDTFPAVTFARPPTVPFLPVLARILLEAEPPSSTVAVSDQFTSGGGVFNVNTLTEFCCRDPGAFPLAERLGVRQPAHPPLKQIARVERNPACAYATDANRVVGHGFEPAIGTESSPERLVRCGVAPFAANFPRTTQIYSG